MAKMSIRRALGKLFGGKREADPSREGDVTLDRREFGGTALALLVGASVAKKEPPTATPEAPKALPAPPRCLSGVGEYFSGVSGVGEYFESSLPGMGIYPGRS